MTTLSFYVRGLPKPQGSKRALMPKGGRRPVVIESAGDALHTWREDVRQAGITAMGASDDWGNPEAVNLTVEFLLPRPKSHYRTGKTTSHLLRDGAPVYHATYPDLDKLLRGLCDALTSAGLWADDSRLVQVNAAKRYATNGAFTGAYVRLSALAQERLEVA